MSGTHTYDVGDVARLSANFQQAGADVDPTTVTVTVTIPDGTATAYVYGTDVEVVKDSAGDYHIDISLDTAGMYAYRWVSTGTGQAAIYGSLRVPSFVSLQQAKDHIRDTSAEGASTDTDLIAKLDAAETMVLDYIGSTAYWRTIRDAWTNATLPQYVRAAILIQFAELWRFRGDDTDSQKAARDPDQDVHPAVAALLRRTRDPVVQ